MEIQRISPTPNFMSSKTNMHNKREMENPKNKKKSNLAINLRKYLIRNKAWWGTQGSYNWETCKHYANLTSVLKAVCWCWKVKEAAKTNLAFLIPLQWFTSKYLHQPERDETKASREQLNPNLQCGNLCPWALLAASQGTEWQEAGLRNQRHDSNLDTPVRHGHHNYELLG